MSRDLQASSTKPTTTREFLLARLEEFLQANPEITDVALGWAATRDSSVVSRLRDGGDVTTRKLDDLLAYTVGFTEFKRKQESNDGTHKG